jgi:predicted O-methyltransferase YrrM
MDEMIRFLESRGQLAIEGSSSPEQQDYLRCLVRRSGARLVGEIGFNAGFSSLAFLSASPDVGVVSFDIGHHEIVSHAKEFLDEHYPGRHELIIGDSELSVPRYGIEHPSVSFDIVFIDGGHDYRTVRADIANLKVLSHPGTGVVIDDLTPWLAWGEGPTKAWSEAIRQGMIVQVEIFKDGRPVHAIAPPGERSWALGRYRYE